MTNANHLEKYLSYRDIAAQLGRSAGTIKRWTAESYLGFPAPRYLGQCAMFLETDIIAWVNQNLTPNAPSSVESARARRPLNRACAYQ